MEIGANYAFVSLIILIVVPQSIFLFGDTFTDLDDYTRTDYDDIINVFGVYNPDAELLLAVNQTVTSDCEETTFSESPITYVWNVLTLRGLREECAQEKLDLIENQGFISASEAGFVGLLCLLFPAFWAVFDIVLGIPLKILLDFVVSVNIMHVEFNIPYWLIIGFYAPFIFMLLAFIIGVIEGLIPFT